MFEHAGQGTARGRGHSVGASPKAGKSSALNVVTSAIRPSSMRTTSSLNARNLVSPGLRVPDLVLADLDPRIPGSEPDPEIQDLLRASEGLNLGVDFLPGSVGFDPLGWTAEPGFASQVLWFDALVHNVDRTWRNPNLLVWHGHIWLIDHGAALYFHHNWPTADPRRPFDASEHVLRDRATGLAEAHAELAPRITETLLKDVTALVPGEWFGDRGADAYTEHLLVRAPIVPEVIRG